MTVGTRRGMIALNGVSEVGQFTLKRELTFPNPGFISAQNAGMDTSKIKPEILAWRTNDEGYLCVPRYYDLEGMTLEVQPPHNLGNFPHRIVNPPKDNRQHGVVSEMADHSGDLGLQLPCGAGKTYLALHYAANRTPGRILIVVPTVVKRDEWVREVCFHMGLTEGDVGLIQGSTRDWEDKSVVVAVLNTLAFQTFPEEVTEGFGAVIWDEAHLVGAPALSQALGKVNGIQITLTATPGRGVRRRIIDLHTGGQWIQRETRTLEGMKFHFVLVPVAPHIQQCDEWRWQKLRVAKSKTYNIVAFNYVRAAVERERRMLVVHGFVDPLLAINNHCKRSGIRGGGFVIGDASLKEIARKEIEDRFADLSSWPKRCRAYKEWAKAEANPLLVTGLTKKMPGGIGMDVPDLDGGIIMLPIADPDHTQQLVGRWERDVEKRPPQIVVMVPQTNIARNIARNMAQKVQRLGLEVEMHDGIPAGYTKLP